MKAITQGEVHISPKDQENLLSHISPETDAVFIEGRSWDIGGRDMTIGYTVFLIGVLLYLWGQTTISNIGGPSIKDRIRDQGVPIHDEIDRSYAKMYDDYPKWMKLSIGSVLFLAFLWALIMPTGYRIINLGTIRLNLTVFERFLYIISVPIGYSLVYVFAEGWLVGGRDDEMIDNIIRTVEEEGYEQIVVSCGQSHLKPISDALEAQGWEVKPNDTNHELLARIYRAPLLEKS